MHQNVIDLVRSFGSAFLPRIVDNGIIELPDFGNMQRNKQRLSRMKQSSAKKSLDIDAVRSKFTDDNFEAEKKEKQRQALSYWFEDTKLAEEEALSERLGDFDRDRRYGLPTIEPLPSVEDSFLAWTSEDAYMLDSRVRESWRDFDDDNTSLVRVDKTAEFKGLESFEKEFVQTAAVAPVPAARARNDFWID